MAKRSALPSLVVGAQQGRSKRSLSRAAAWTALTGGGAALLMLGCGHPATRGECDEIFNRSAEIELRMQNVTDPKLIEERTAVVRKDRGEDLILRCVGKRITEEAMACVRQAKTTEEMDRCLQ